MDSLSEQERLEKELAKKKLKTTIGIIKHDIITDANVGDIVWFGSHEQDGSSSICNISPCGSKQANLSYLDGRCRKASEWWKFKKTEQAKVLVK